MDDQNTSAAARLVVTTPLRILIAEDNPDRLLVTRVFDSLFGATDYLIDRADSGREAVSMAQAFDYDIIFLDCLLQELDCYQVAGELRGLENSFLGLRHVPIIALTEDTTVEACVKRNAAGMDDCLIKPIGSDAVRRVLETWVIAPRDQLTDDKDADSTAA
jgi:CheY-like chemotaxis protein